MSEYTRENIKDSSFIEEIAYHKNRELLEVKISKENKEDTVYFYQNVPVEIYELI